MYVCITNNVACLRMLHEEKVFINLKSLTRPLK